MDQGNTIEWIHNIKIFEKKNIQFLFTWNLQN